MTRFLLRVHFVGVLGALTVLTGCGRTVHQNRRSAAAPQPEVAAPLEIGSSFLVDNGDGKSPSLPRLAISRTSLDKEFLLQASAITQEYFPAWNGLKSRIVAFKQGDGHLYMLEAASGHTMHTSLKDYLLLADFPITSETPTHLFFDFNAGMAKIFTSADWRASDFEGSQYQPDSWTAVDTSTSYLESARLIGRERLEVTQVAQLNLSQGTSANHPAVVMRYNILPYAPAGTFVPLKSPGFERLGFFEVAPQLRTGGANDVVYATKWSTERPVVYALSANTPQAFRPAIRDAILYWNKVFGREVVQVIDAPAGITAPDYDYNVVQWIDFPNAGFAYADAQMDPRTGEILHASVFLTSAFAVGGKQEARRLLQQLNEFDQKSKGTLTAGHQVALTGFATSALCRMSQASDRHFASALSQLVDSQANDATILKISQDYVREVVAHEIGHTLGLRHNFAGSTAVSYNFNDRRSVVDEYITSGHTPAGTLPTSTVMDYQLFEESAMTGDLLAKAEGALPYDQMAINALYLGGPVDRTDGPLFCTDSRVSHYLDCLPFDLGASPLEYAQWDLHESLDGLPKLLASQFALMKAPATGVEKVPLNQLDISGEDLASYALFNRLLIPQALTSDAMYLSVERQFAVANSLNHDEVQDAYRTALAADVQRLGGIDQLLALPTGEGARHLATFKTMIHGPYRSGIGGAGQNYRFSDEEVATMERLATKIFGALDQGIALVDTELLAGPTALADDAVTDDFAAVLKARVETLVFATKDTTAQTIQLPETDGSMRTVNVILPTYTQDQKVRLEAAKLFNGQRGMAAEWGVQEALALTKTFRAQLNEALTTDIDQIALDGLPKPVMKWVLENRLVLAGLTNSSVE